MKCLCFEPVLLSSVPTMPQPQLVEKRSKPHDTSPVNSQTINNLLPTPPLQTALANGTDSLTSYTTIVWQEDEISMIRKSAFQEESGK